MNKYYLTYSPSTIEGTYTVVGPFSTTHVCDPIYIDDLIFDGSAKEIIVNHVLEYIDLDKLEPTIRGWAQKLQFGGKLIINCQDARIVAQSFYFGHITLEQYNDLVYKNDGFPKKLALTSDIINNLLEQCGLTIELKRYEGTMYCVVATRPNPVVQ